MIECSKCGIGIDENNYSLIAPLWAWGANIIGCLKCFPHGVRDMSPFISRGNTDWNKFSTIAINGYPLLKHIFCDRILRLNDLLEEGIAEAALGGLEYSFYTKGR